MPRICELPDGSIDDSAYFAFDVTGAGSAWRVNVGDFRNAVVSQAEASIVPAAVTAVHDSSLTFNAPQSITPDDGDPALMLGARNAGTLGLRIMNPDLLPNPVFAIEALGQIWTNQVELTPTDTTALNGRLAIYDADGNLFGYIPLHQDVP